MNSAGILYHCIIHELDTVKMEIVSSLFQITYSENTGQKTKPKLERINEGTVIFAQVQTPSTR